MRELQRSNQRGFGLLIILALLGVFVATAMVTVARGATSSAQREAQTQRALAIAKQALVDYAAGVALSGGRPGDLPCPDLKNDGMADTTTSCYNPSAPSSARLLGRLPWKTLGLPDLRDGDGERLWYAVSPIFVNNSRTACPAPGTMPTTLPPISACLNSNSKGAITVRDPNAFLVNNGAVQATAAVAVIIAPGAVITRLDKTTPQNRSCSGDPNLANCQATQVCSPVGSVYTGTALCNPVNYLDIMVPVTRAPAPVGNREDNATFLLNTSSDGFIQGPIIDSLTGATKVNDIVMTVTLADVMIPVQQRVAREVLGCLRNYAIQNSGRYPWANYVPGLAGSFSGSSLLAPYSLPDSTGVYFGHVPDTLSNTNSSSGALAMSGSWPANCAVGPGVGWWMNWKDLVFYGVAKDFAPDSVSPPPACDPTCLTVSPLQAADQVVVIVAGPPLTGQSRPSTNESCITDSWLCNSYSNYLELGNNSFSASNAAGTSGSYQTASPSTSFNDVVVYFSDPHVYP